MRLLAKNGRSVSGSITYRGRDLVALDPAQLWAIRWHHISIIFQGAMNALDPVKKVGAQIAEPIKLHEHASERSCEVPGSSRQRPSIRKRCTLNGRRGSFLSRGPNGRLREGGGHSRIQLM